MQARFEIRPDDGGYALKVDQRGSNVDVTIQSPYNRSWSVRLTPSETRKLIRALRSTLPPEPRVTQMQQQHISG